jgi:hypothetical protein
MKDIYIGVDPGGRGFISIYVSKENKWEFFEVPKIGKFVDTNAMSRFFKGISTLIDLEGLSAHLVLEDVHALFGSSSKSTFSFGYVVGMIEAMIVSNNIPFTKVQPKAWQKLMWAGVPLQKKLSGSGKTYVTDTKLMSKMAAKRLFPTMDFRRNDRCSVDDDNKIDSVLMAEYCKRNF